jgi:hypothetical protein
MSVESHALESAIPCVSVVIPTLNEARNLPHVFAGLPADLHEAERPPAAAAAAAAGPRAGLAPGGRAGGVGGDRPRQRPSAGPGRPRPGRSGRRSCMPDAHAEGLPKLQRSRMRRRYPTGVLGCFGSAGRWPTIAAWTPSPWACDAGGAAAAAIPVTPTSTTAAGPTAPSAAPTPAPATRRRWSWRR